jgi:hypothetical protein
LDSYYWVPIIIFFVVVILDLVFIPYLFFALSLLKILPPYGVVQWLYVFSLILLIIAGIIYWFGERR